MAIEEAAKPSPIPPYPEMILEAIEGLGDKNGSNKSSISKYIQGKYGELPPAHACLLTAHLARMKESGEVILLKNHYFRADAPGAPPKRGRGRPPRAWDPLEAAVKQANAGMPKARGHLPKKAKIEDGVSLAHAPAPAPVGDGSTPVKRGRGRPPKKPEYPTEIFYGVEIPECWKFQHSKPEYLTEMFQKRRQRIAIIAGVVGMYHFDTYMNQSEYRVPTESRYEWVMKTLGNRTCCYNMFMMNRNVFDKLHICLWSHMD